MLSWNQYKDHVTSLLRILQELPFLLRVKENLHKLAPLPFIQTSYHSLTLITLLPAFLGQVEYPLGPAACNDLASDIHMDHNFILGGISAHMVLY